MRLTWYACTRYHWSCRRVMETLTKECRFIVPTGAIQMLCVNDDQLFCGVPAASRADFLAACSTLSVSAAAIPTA